MICLRMTMRVPPIGCPGLLPKRFKVFCPFGDCSRTCPACTGLTRTERRPSTGQQPGTKSGRRPKDEPPVSRSSTGCQPVIGFLDLVKMGFHMFVHPNKTPGRSFFCFWARKRYVGRSLGAPLRPASVPPRTASPSPASPGLVPPRPAVPRPVPPRSARGISAFWIRLMNLRCSNQRCHSTPTMARLGRPSRL